MALYIKLNIRLSGARLAMLGKTSRRILVRAEEHAGKDKNSHLYQHTIKAEHELVTIKDLSILSNNASLFYNRKISESLFIKSIKSSLNVQ